MGGPFRSSRRSLAPIAILQDGDRHPTRSPETIQAGLPQGHDPATPTISLIRDGVKNGSARTNIPIVFFESELMTWINREPGQSSVPLSASSARLFLNGLPQRQIGSRSRLTCRLK